MSPRNDTIVGLGAVKLPVPREPAPLPVLPTLPARTAATLRRGRTPVLRVVRFPFGAVPEHHTGEPERRILDVTAIELAPGDITVEIVDRGTKAVVPLDSLCGSDADELGRAVMVRMRVVESEVAS